MNVLLLALRKVLRAIRRAINREERLVTYNFNEIRWIVGGSPIAEIGSAHGSHSAPNALALFGDGLPGHTQDLDVSVGEIPWEGMTVGMFYTITAWVNADAAVQGSPVMFYVGVPNFHVPYRFGLLKFVGAPEPPTLIP